MFSARNNVEEQELWLKDYFARHEAGAEFMLPWMMDTYFVTMNRLKTMFTPGELKTIIEAHKEFLLDTAHLRLPHLLLQVTEQYERHDLCLKYGASLQRLEHKFRQLDETQTAILILWAASFWHGSNVSAESMERYLSLA